MRVSLTYMAAVLALLAAPHAYACGTSTPEYKAGRDAFYKCFSDHLDEQQGTTNADALAHKATGQWCAGELQSWYGTLHDGCEGPAPTDQQNAQGFGVFQSNTTKGLADMIQAARNRAK